jgi:LacI family transcriptional regulator
VSRVVNNAPGVNAITRQNVERAIAELHYVPNLMAKSLRSKQTQTIALLLTDIANPFWTTIARGVEDAAGQRGYHVILCNSDEDPGKELNYIDILLQRRVDGIILAPSTDDKKRLLALKRHNVPFVLVDRWVEDFKTDLIRSDNKTGARELIQHLIRLGHRSIAIVSGPAGISTAVDRLAGYREALRESGIPFRQSLVKQGTYRLDHDHASVAELLDEPDPPTAVFATNNFIAMGILETLRRLGKRVPEDIALVCFDDLPQASVIYPFLTVCAQDAYRMGTLAAELLIERITSRAARRIPRDIMLNTRLIVRKSCGAELARRATAPSERKGAAHE